jgi:hypothetical protein
LARFGHLYIWFVIIVAAIAGLPRLVLSRRFAELQKAKLQQPNALARSRTMSMVLSAVVLVFFGLYFTRWGHDAWVQIAIIFSFLSAAEFFFQSRFNSVDALTFQNRLLGILYLGLSIGSYIALKRT